MCFVKIFDLTAGVFFYFFICFDLYVSLMRTHTQQYARSEYRTPRAKIYLDEIFEIFDFTQLECISFLNLGA